MKAAQWIDQAKRANSWESDYRAAKELGLSRNTISVYRSKPDATMDDETAVKVAGALDLEPELVIVDQVAERTKSEPARAALTGLLRRMAGKGRRPFDETSVAAKETEYTLHLQPGKAAWRRLVAAFFAPQQQFALA